MNEMINTKSQNNADTEHSAGLHDAIRCNQKLCDKFVLYVEWVYIYIYLFLLSNLNERMSIFKTWLIFIAHYFWRLRLQGTSRRVECKSTDVGLVSSFASNLTYLCIHCKIYIPSNGQFCLLVFFPLELKSN